MNTETRAGRMLDALLRTENEKGKVLLTVAVAASNGGGRLHETFSLRKWRGRNGDMISMSAQSTGDWNATPPVKPAQLMHFNPATGQVLEAKAEPRNQNPLLRYAARAAWVYASEGRLLEPTNGSVTVSEVSVCGACGLPLTDDVSISLGIGPECEEKIYGTRTPRSRTISGKAQAEIAKQAAEAEIVPVENVQETGWDRLIEAGF